MIEPWLQHHLEQTGAWNADGISRNAKSRRCYDCGMWVLAGLDDPKCGGVAVVDTAALNPLGEAVAVLTGRSTYTLRRFSTRIELDDRHQWAITARPAGTTGADVVAEHQCRVTTSPVLTAPTAYTHTSTEEPPDAPPY